MLRAALHRTTCVLLLLPLVHITSAPGCALLATRTTAIDVHAQGLAIEAMPRYTQSCAPKIHGAVRRSRYHVPYAPAVGVHVRRHGG